MQEKSPLKIDQFELGPMANYIYFISNEKTKDAYVVDPAWDSEFIYEQAQKQNLNLKGMLITHGHPDHTNGINALLKHIDIPVYVSQDEASFYKPICENIIDVKPGESLTMGDFEIKLLHTPGHTPGSQCFYIEAPSQTYHAGDNLEFVSKSIVISGDTLFLDGCGRCDMPGGNAEIMFDSIANILMKLPDETVIFPGHNYHHQHCDCLSNQKKTNPYLQYDNLKQFIDKRMK